MPGENGSIVNLFDSNFMGKANGLVGEPLKSAGFYVENPSDGNFRDDVSPVHLNRPDPNDPAT